VSFIGAYCACTACPIPTKNSRIGKMHLNSLLLFMLTQLILILQVGIITYLFAYTPANLMDYSGNTKDKKTRKSSIIGFTSHSLHLGAL
jgi:hypothetical protein